MPIAVRSCETKLISLLDPHLEQQHNIGSETYNTWLHTGVILGMLV